MPSISPVEFMVVAILALIVFGPQKLPEVARTVGKAISELRRQAEDLKAEFRDGMSLEDQPEPDLDDDDEDEPAAKPWSTGAAEVPASDTVELPEPPPEAVDDRPAPDKVEDD
jgi:Tat protein translocase TatB subunit